MLSEATASVAGVGTVDDDACAGAASAAATTDASRTNEQTAKRGRVRREGRNVGGGATIKAKERATKR